MSGLLPAFENLLAFRPVGPRVSALNDRRFVEPPGSRVSRSVLDRRGAHTGCRTPLWAAGVLAACLAWPAFGQGIEIVALETVTATVLSVEGNLGRLDAGLTAGVRPGDIAEVFYQASVGASKRRVVVNRGEVVEVDEFTSVLEVEPEFMIQSGYLAEFEIPRNRISPMGIVDLARSKLEERVTVDRLRTLIDRLVPEDEFIEQQFVRLLDERRRVRQGGVFETDSGSNEPTGPSEGVAPSSSSAEASASSSAAEARSGADFRYEGDYHEPEILAMVQAWAQAWADRNVDQYLAFYSRSFRPPQGLSRDAWTAQRRQRLRRPRFIKLSLVFDGAQSVGVGRGWAKFRQTYRSNTFSDVVIKRLELVWEGDDWKILQEKVED